MRRKSVAPRPASRRGGFLGFPPLRFGHAPVALPRYTLAASVTLVTTLLLSACASDMFQHERPAAQPPPPVNRQATATTEMADALQ